MADSFQEGVESWAGNLLDDYVERLKTRSPSLRSKEFNDPIWGTILLRPAEVAVLDSPLVQRLRTVSQLGVVHLVYPAATHSRLEHTLGVVHQVARLVNSINERFEASNRAVSEQEEALLRLTALCHDVGHGALSHVSENALESFEQVEELSLAFTDEVGAESVPLAEMAAFYILGSPSFKELLKTVQGLVPNHGWFTVGQSVDFMQRAVIGQPISDQVPLLQELISGPFDADKLDYMTRDAKMSGVPVVTDIPRLVQKVRAVRVSPEELPAEIASTVKGGHAAYVVTGIDVSGGRTVDELILGRTLQEDKLFRHHKVRAIEAMVASIYRQLAACEPSAAPMLPFRLEDSDFVHLDEHRVAEVIGRPLTNQDRGSVQVAIDLARRLRDRVLFVRAYAFSLGMPLDPYRSDAAHFAGLERLARESGNFPQRGKLIDAIVEELQNALELTESDLRDEYPDLKPYIWLDPLYAHPEPNDSARAYLIAEGPGERQVLRFQDDYAETVRWAAAYTLTRDLGYVFATADLALHTYVATEKVLRRDYNIRTPQSMEIYAKKSAGDLATLKELLAAKGYYEAIAYDVRPVPVRLQQADIQARIAGVCERLGGYEGPVRGGAVDKKRTLLSGERVLAWLRQFPPSLEDEPLRMLEEMRLISRHDVVAAVQQFLGAHVQEFQGGAICPLGEPKDSSAVTTYWSNDQTVGEVTVMSIGDALAHSAAPPIIFLEDFIGSGQQSVSILESWLSEEPTTELGESRSPLSVQAAEALRGRKLAFVFAAGTAQGKERLENRCGELELDATVEIADDVVPQAFTGDLSDLRSELKACTEEVGRQLLADSDSDHDESWIEERVLGYGNHAFLVLFAYNTPTQTLTCLWKDGVFEELPWMALFPRRPKH